MKRPVHARTVPAFWNRGDILSLLPPEERPVETWTAHYSFKSRKHVVELSGQRQAPSRGSLPLEAADTFLASLSGTLERRLPCPGCLRPGRRPFKLRFADGESPLGRGVFGALRAQRPGHLSPTLPGIYLPAHSAECFCPSGFSPVSRNSIVFFSSYSARLLYSLILSLQQLYI